MAKAEAMEEAAEGAPVERPAQAGSAERLWTPVFLLIIAATLGAYMVGQGTNAGTSVYLDIRGESATLAGIGAAIFSIAGAVSRLVCAPFIDNRGRVAVMIAGSFFLIAGTLGPTFLTSMKLFWLWRLLQGVGFATVTTASATAAADVLPASRLGEGIGYYGLGQAISMSIGPALALALVATDPAENLFLGLCAAAVMGLVFSLLCRYEKDPSRLPATSEYRRRHEQGLDRQQSAKITSVRQLVEPKAIPGTIPMMVLSPAFGFGIYFAGLLGTTLGVGNAGLYYTLSAVAMIAVRLKSGAFMDTVAPIKLMTFAVASGLACFSMLFGASLQILPADINGLLFYAAGIPYGLCLGVAPPVNQTVAVKNSPSERWGAASALFLLAIDVGIGLACIAWGVVNDTLGFTATLACVIVIVALSLVAAWIFYPAHDKRWRR
ncbi:MAG: MFS transporter [Eggerthellaceae bacterium]|nr:MFS transporter [Eggerthellaceae bacterium]